MAQVGRPTDYNDEIVSKICELLMMGQSLRSICRQDNMPGLSTICEWLSKRVEFAEQYARARETQADLMAEDIIEIADTAKDKNNAHAVQVRVDARKWIASKLKPKTYSDHLKVEAEIKGDIKITFNLDNDIPPNHAI